MHQTSSNKTFWEGKHFNRNASKLVMSGQLLDKQVKFDNMSYTQMTGQEQKPSRQQNRNWVQSYNDQNAHQRDKKSLLTQSEKERMQLLSSTRVTANQAALQTKMIENMVIRDNEGQHTQQEVVQMNSKTIAYYSKNSISYYKSCISSGTFIEQHGPPPMAFESNQLIQATEQYDTSLRDQSYVYRFTQYLRYALQDAGFDAPPLTQMIFHACMILHTGINLWSQIKNFNSGNFSDRLSVSSRFRNIVQTSPNQISFKLLLNAVVQNASEASKITHIDIMDDDFFKNAIRLKNHVLQLNMVCALPLEVETVLDQSSPEVKEVKEIMVKSVKQFTLNLLYIDRQFIIQMLDTLFNVLSEKSTTKQVDTSGDYAAQSSDQVFIMSCYVRVVALEAGVESTFNPRSGLNTEKLDQYGLLMRSIGSAKIAGARAFNGPSSITQRLLTYFFNITQTAGCYRKNIVNYTFVEDQYKLILESLSVPCLVECIANIIINQYIDMFSDDTYIVFQNGVVSVNHPISYILEGFSQLQTVKDFQIRRRTRNYDNQYQQQNNTTKESRYVNSYEYQAWLSFAWYIGYYKGLKDDQPCLMEGQTDCIPSFIQKTMSLIYDEIKASDEGCFMRQPYVVMIDEMMMFMQTAELETLAKIIKEHNYSECLTTCKNVDTDSSRSQSVQFNFMLLKYLFDMHKQKVDNTKQFVSSERLSSRSFLMPDYSATIHCNYIIGVMDNHAQVMDIFKVNKIIILYTNYLYDMHQKAMKYRITHFDQRVNDAEDDSFDMEAMEVPDALAEAEGEVDNYQQSDTFSSKDEVLSYSRIKRSFSQGMYLFIMVCQVIMEYYGEDSQKEDIQLQNSQFIEKKLDSMVRYKHMLQRFKSIAPDDASIGVENRTKEFHRLGLAAIDIETVKIDNLPDRQQLFNKYGIDPATVGNQIPYMISMHGKLYNGNNNKYDLVDVLFVSSPDHMDSCIDQLIAYLIKNAYMYGAQKPGKRLFLTDKGMETITNMFWTFNGSNFDFKFLFPRIEKFQNIHSHQGSCQSLKQFRTYNCLFQDLQQYFGTQSLLSVSKNLLDGTDYSRHVKFKFEGGIENLDHDRIHDILLLYKVCKMSCSSYADRFSLKDPKNMSDEDYKNVINSFINTNHRMLTIDDIARNASMFKDLYYQAYMVSRYCMQDSRATCYSTKVFFEQLLKTNVKTQVNAMNSDIQFYFQAIDMSYNSQKKGCKYNSDMLVKAIHRMLDNNVTFKGMFTYRFVQDLPSNAKTKFNFNFNYVSFIETLLSVSGPSMSFDMAMSSLCTQLNSVTCTLDYESKSYAAGLTMQLMRESTIGTSIDINSCYPAVFPQHMPVFHECFIYIMHLQRSYLDMHNVLAQQKYKIDVQGIDMQQVKDLARSMSHNALDPYINGCELFSRSQNFQAYEERFMNMEQHDQIYKLSTVTDPDQMTQEQKDMFILDVEKHLQSKFRTFCPYHLYRVRKFRFDKSITHVPCIPIKVFNMYYVCPLKFDRNEDRWSNKERFKEYLGKNLTEHDKRRIEKQIHMMEKGSSNFNLSSEDFDEYDQNEFIDCWVWGVVLNQAILNKVQILCVDKVIRYVGMPFLSSYCNTMYDRKKNAKSKCEKTMYKLFLNSLYGKFAQRSFSKNVLTNPDQMTQQYLDLVHDKDFSQVDAYQMSNLGAYKTYGFKYIDDINKYMVNNVYKRISSFITASGKVNLLEAAHRIGNYMNYVLNAPLKYHFIAYMDTDSIYVTFDPILKYHKELQEKKPGIYTKMRKLLIEDLSSGGTDEQTKMTIASNPDVQYCIKFAINILNSIGKNVKQFDQAYISDREYSVFKNTSVKRTPQVSILHPTKLGSFKIEKICLFLLILGQKMYTTYAFDVEGQEVINSKDPMFTDTQKIHIDVKLKGVKQTVVKRNFFRDMVKDSYVDIDHKNELIEGEQYQNKRTKFNNFTESMENRVKIPSAIPPIQITFAKNMTDGSHISQTTKVISESPYKVKNIETVLSLEEEENARFWSSIISMMHYIDITRKSDLIFSQTLMKKNYLISHDITTLQSNMMQRYETKDIENVLSELRQNSIIDDTNRIKLRCYEKLIKDSFQQSMREKCDGMIMKSLMNCQVNKKQQQLITRLNFLKLKIDPQQAHHFYMSRTVLMDEQVQKMEDEPMSAINKYDEEKKMVDDKIQRTHAVDDYDYIMTENQKRMIEYTAAYQKFMEDNYLEAYCNQKVRDCLLPIRFASTIPQLKIYNSSQGAEDVLDTGVNIANSVKIDKVLYVSLTKLKYLKNYTIAKNVNICIDQMNHQTLCLLNTMYEYLYCIDQIIKSKDCMTYWQNVIEVNDLVIVEDVKSQSDIKSNIKSQSDIQSTKTSIMQFSSFNGFINRYQAMFVHNEAMHLLISKNAPYLSDKMQSSVNYNMNSFHVYQFIIFMIILFSQHQEHNKSIDMQIIEQIKSFFKQYVLSASEHILPNTHFDKRYSSIQNKEYRDCMLDMCRYPEKVNDIQQRLNNDPRYQKHMKMIIPLFQHITYDTKKNEQRNTMEHLIKYLISLKVIKENTEQFTNQHIRSIVNSFAKEEVHDDEMILLTEPNELQSINALSDNIDSSPQSKSQSDKPKQKRQKVSFESLHDAMLYAYCCVGFSSPLHYQYIDKISNLYKDLTNGDNGHQLIEKRDLYVQQYLSKYKNKAHLQLILLDAIVMQAFVYAIMLHSNTRDKWFHVFNNSHMFLCQIKLNNFVLTEQQLVDQNHIQLTWTILKSQNFQVYIKKLMSTSFQVSQVPNKYCITALIHMYSCFRYVTSNASQMYELTDMGREFIPSMCMTKNMGDIVRVPSEYYKVDGQGVEQSKIKNEFMMQVWYNVYLKYMESNLPKTDKRWDKPTEMQKMLDTQMQWLNKQLKDNQFSTESKSVTISYDETVQNILSQHKNLVQNIHSLDSTHENNNKIYEDYKQILETQNQVLQDVNNRIHRLTTQNNSGIVSNIIE